MALPSDATLSADLRAALLADGGADATDNAALTAFCNVVAAWVSVTIKAASVSVPAAGLNAPNGGGAVTGAATGAIT